MCSQQYTGKLHINSNNLEEYLHTLKLTLLLMVESKS